MGKDVINYLIPHLSKEVLSATNENGSPAIHWAILNNHVNCVKALVELPEEQGGGIQLLKVCIYRHDMCKARLMCSKQIEQVEMHLPNRYLLEKGKKRYPVGSRGTYGRSREMMRSCRKTREKMEMSS